MRALLVSLLALAALGAACPNDTVASLPTGPADVTSEHFVPPPLPQGRIFFEDAFGTRHGIEVEIAATTDSRTRGLMWRRSLPAGKGMLFVFDYDEDHSFWMKNTLIPLDMLFVAADGTVVGIIENTVPHSLVSRAVGRPSRHVLEVPGGWSGKVGLRTGTRLELQLPAGIEIE